MKWASEYGSKNTIYTVLIDTDQEKIFNNLKNLEEELGKQNLWVASHRELQERLISLKNEN
jgi:metal-dependent hydrolase (beta-lactamase superfamily II)